MGRGMGQVSARSIRRSLGTFLLFIALSFGFASQPRAQTLVEVSGSMAPLWKIDVIDRYHTDETFNAAEDACVAGIAYDNARYPNGPTRIFASAGPLQFRNITYLPKGYSRKCNDSNLFAVPICNFPTSKAVLVDSGAAIRCFPPLEVDPGECEACKAGASPLSEPPLPTIGNPIAVDSGAKVQTELDYTTADGMLQISRHYRSKQRNLNSSLGAEEISGFGDDWHGLIPGRLTVSSSNVGGEQSFDRMDYYSPSGTTTRFTTDPIEQQNWVFGSSDSTRLRMSMVAIPSINRSDYFAFGTAPTDGSGEIKLSSANGDYVLFRRADAYDQAIQVRHLVPVEQGFASGYKLFFDYPDTGQFPNKVHDSLNRELILTWTDVTWGGVSPIETRGRAISAIGLPDGTSLAYAYGFANGDDGPGWKSRLKQVKRLDGTGLTLWGRAYHYEDGRFPHALTGTSDQNGARLSTYSYSAAGLAASTERAGGIGRETIRYFKDSANPSYDVRQVTNALGHQTNYLFVRPGGTGNVPRRLASISGVATPNIPAITKTFGYSSNGLLTSSTNGNGNATGQVNDSAAKRPTSSTDAAGVVTNLAWHPTLDLVMRETRLGLQVDYIYDTSGRMLSRTETDTMTQSVPYTTNGQTRSSTYAWGANGRLLSVNGPRAVNAAGQDDVTTYSYDAQGNRVSMTNALSHVTSFAGFDANGRPNAMTDANGVKTLYSYDPLGRIKTVTVKHPSDAALDAVTAVDYDVEGRAVSITRPETIKLNFDYDLAGRLLAMRSDDGEGIEYSYDAMSNVLLETVKRTDASTARITNRTFDELGRMLTETLGPGRTMTWAYDKEGNPTRMTSARGNATVQAFDALDRLISVVAPDAGTSTSVYDERDGVSRFIDAKAVQTQFVRNGFGDVIREISPDRGTSTYTYDEAGDMIRAVDGRGQRLDYTRDILGRLLRKRPVGQPATENIDYIWDVPGITGSFGIGRLARIADATGVTKWSYDHHGNIVTQQQKLAGTADFVALRYTYDLADRIERMTYPSGRQVQYSRDAKGRVMTVRTRASAAITSWTQLSSAIKYEPFGSLRSMTLGNGLKVAIDWGNEGRLISRRLFRSAGDASLSLLTYAYDGDDNITAISDSVNSVNNRSFGYDANGRLSRTEVATGAVRRVDYIHDTNGNRLREERRALPGDVISQDSDTYAITPGRNRLASVTTPTGTRSLTYDGRGNPVSESRPDALGVVLAYDSYGHLTSYARTGEAALGHLYNGLDDRVATTRGSETRRFVTDPDGRILGEYGATASDVKAEYIWMQPEVANDNGAFGGDDGTGGYAPLAVAVPDGNGATTLNWVYGNHLGVPLVTTDASGTVAAAADYAALGFPGQTRTLADLYYNRYRDYDPTTGRYLQSDPIGLAGGDNPYSYAEGNPLSVIDPLGLDSSASAVARVGFEFWVERQLRPTKRIPIFGQAIAVGEAIGVAAAVGIYLYRNCNDEGTGGTPNESGNNRDRCKQEWQEALEICQSELSKSHPSRSITGGHYDLQECARGFVSKACGGNRTARYLDQYTRRPFRPNRRRR
jgi:RHS repeat-associated protein